MKAQRSGTNRLIEARLRAYHKVIFSGGSKEEAMKKAQAITRKTLKKK